MRQKYYLIPILLFLMISSASISAAKDQTETETTHRQYIVAVISKMYPSKSGTARLQS